MVLIFSATQVQAGPLHPFVDPYLGWALLGSTNQNQSDGANTHANNFNGVTLGTRGGVRFLKYFFSGLDFSYQTSLAISPTSVSYFTSGATATRLGLIVGVNDPVLPFRFWIGFNFLDKIDQTLYSTQNGIVPGSIVDLSGSGWKIGLGLTMLPLVSLNLEYIISQYGSLSVNQVSTSMGDGISGYGAHLFLLSASIPLTFSY